MYIVCTSLLLSKNKNEWKKHLSLSAINTPFRKVYFLQYQVCFALVKNQSLHTEIHNFRSIYIWLETWLMMVQCCEKQYLRHSEWRGRRGWAREIYLTWKKHTIWREISANDTDLYPTFILHYKWIHPLLGGMGRWWAMPLMGGGGR